MAQQQNTPGFHENEYRKVSKGLGAAHDPSAVKRMNLENDQVSVVHSGESDPMPNQEAQQAFADEGDGAVSDHNLSDETDENDFEYQQGEAEGLGKPDEEGQP